MEGQAAEESFGKMKKEGMSPVKQFYGDLCGGHYTRAHYNQLKK